MRQVAEQVAEGLGAFSGYVGIDLVVSTAANDRTTAHAIEINPRLTTSYVGLRRLARFNIMQVMFNVLGGKPTGPLEYSPGEIVFLPDGTFPIESES